MDAEFVLDCAVCAQPRPAEVPPCFDDHDDGCPDRICSRCGTALFVDPYLTVPFGDARRYGAA